MPIVQLQSEFAAALSIAPPSYTWSGKPSAAGNSGMIIRVTDQMNSLWRSDGTYWLPEGGNQCVYSPVLSGVTSQSATLQVVSGLPGWSIPSDMAGIPRLCIEAYATCSVSPPSSAQARQIYIGVDADKNCIASHQYTSTSSGKRVWGRLTKEGSSTNWTAYAGNANYVADGTSRNSVLQSDLIASPIRLYYRGGNTDGSETITVVNFAIEVGVGP